MKYDYDIITLGLGPAGMAVSIMGAEMGLKVCAIEKHRIGGECMNVGCIPSKSFLKMAKSRSGFEKLEALGLAATEKPKVIDPFSRIDSHLNFIRDKKTLSMFDKVDLLYQTGAGSFVDKHTIQINEKTISAKRIFICTGTQPAIPDFPGIHDIDYLTNNNMFALDQIPESMIVVGGGAIACEMAQAFARLGSRITMIIRGPKLMWREGQESIKVLEDAFAHDQINILRNQSPTSFANQGDMVLMKTNADEEVLAQKVLVAAGRKLDFSELKLENAGVKYSDQGIGVNKYLQTSSHNIFACGDCNGYAQLSHAAMHQGMIAIMNSMMPRLFRKNFQKFPVPWTVFTEPQFSHVGLTERELEAKGISHETITINYGDYGAAIAELVEQGHLRVFVTRLGRILGVDIIGEGSGEMINEWTLAIQKKMRISDIMMTQHSFPTMGFLTKRTAETWMMNRMKSGFLKSLCRFMFRH